MNSQLKKPPRFVVTGPPFSGVSTLASALRYYVEVYPDAEKAVIDKGLARGMNVKSIRDGGWFRADSLERQLRMEQEADKKFGNRVVVFEKGVPDSIISLTGAMNSSGEILAFARDRYTGIFQLEPLRPTSEKIDAEELELRSTQKALLQEVYTNLGYPIFSIRADPKEKMSGGIPKGRLLEVLCRIWQEDFLFNQ